MKYLIILAVATFLIVAAILYFGAGALDLAPKKTEAAQQPAAPTQDFQAVTALLEQDMTNIPASLDAPRVAPANAFSVKSRLGSAPTAHAEYQVLVQACDLIIYADQEHSVRQRRDQETAQGVSGDPMATEKANHAATSTARTTLHARAQADWDAYRQQTDAEVHRLLGSLQGAKL